MAKQPADASATSRDAALHLLALDNEDLEIISAHLQDAIVRIGDMAYVPAQRRFALVASRFDWAAATDGAMRRRAAGLHFDSVLKVQRMGFEQAEQDAVLNLLSIAFEAGDAPGGNITLLFSAGAAIRLDVECIDAQMNDIGAGWRARRRPQHGDPPQT